MCSQQRGDCAAALFVYCGLAERQKEILVQDTVLVGHNVRGCLQRQGCISEMCEVRAQVAVV
jgi:hypothetical protein